MSIKSETTDNVKAALEAVLFAMGDSVELGKLAQAVGCSEKVTKEVLDELKEECDREDRGIRLLELEGSYQFCTKKEYFDCLITIAKTTKKPVLTDVVLETLAIIAYRQPITKGEIETIRGVKSDHAVNKLIEYDLVQELGRLDAPGRPILLGTTETFLRNFGLDSMEELPELNPVLLEDFKAEAEAEIPV
ncbi:MAG: SMC-Scp complex subunit ScpB [Lachnospiraceae bacterium]|nr:SMC-Scp complex subunit ScpB [Lachnospiraceae bacterium]